MLSFGNKFNFDSGGKLNSNNRLDRLVISIIFKLSYDYE